MSDTSTKLLKMAPAELVSLHERLHKTTEPDSATIEVHHLAINEMGRRGMALPSDDEWEKFQVEIDFMENADLIALGGTLPEEVVADILKSTGSAFADVVTVLTIHGYELKIMEKHGSGDQKAHGNWAHGGGGDAERVKGAVWSKITSARSDAVLTGTTTALPRDLQGRIINPNATGGYKSNVPEKVMVTLGKRDVQVTPNDSLWAHLVPRGSGVYKLSQLRSHLYGNIVAKSVDGVQPAVGQKTFTLLGGGPASGKTTAVENGLGNVPSPKDAVYVNADTLKEGLPEYNSMRYSTDHGNFYNAAAYVHEESSSLARIVTATAMQQGKNIVLDGTGDSGANSLRAKIQGARDAGYKINAVYINRPTSDALSSNLKRSLGSEHRYVPDSVVIETHKQVSSTFDHAVKGGLFDHVTLIDNTNFGRSKVIAEGYGSNLIVHDKVAYDTFIAKGGGN